jgi:beta-glucosidase
MTTRISFPRGFLWGSATSAYQIEGSVKRDGRGESIWDRFSSFPGNIVDGSSGEVACDHYRLWESDLDLIRDLGHNAYRFSVAWPRILPTGRGIVNTRGLDFYCRLVDGLLTRGITPFVTLYHWDLPQALQDVGGWASRETAYAFAEFAEVVGRSLGDRVKSWITHNEPWCSSFVAHRMGSHAPGIRDASVARLASHHILLSHGLAVPILRSHSASCKVGITLNLSSTIPASPSPEDVDAARRRDGDLNRWFLDPIFRGSYPADLVMDAVRAGELKVSGMDCILDGDMRAISTPTDFLGINYYSRIVARSDAIGEDENHPRTVQVAPRSEWTDIGWEVYADGMFETLVRTYLEYRPSVLYVTENGASYSDSPGVDRRVVDSRRIAYLRSHLLSAARAIEVGVPLAGYFAWSLLDNFEWVHGYTQRFGMCWTDYATQERIPKESAYAYRRIIEENGVVV